MVKVTRTRIMESDPERTLGQFALPRNLKLQQAHSLTCSLHPSFSTTLLFNPVLVDLPSTTKQQSWEN